MLGDNLGSTNVIINGLGEVEQRLAFDPWGMRTAIPGFSDAVNGVTNRGYTGHEMDDEVGLVNMNARIYDPVLGRFLSADGVLPDPYDLQAFNRYSYVGNNPLKYTDPTGHVKRCLGCAGAPAGGIGGGERHAHDVKNNAEPSDNVDGSPPNCNAAGICDYHDEPVPETDSQTAGDGIQDPSLPEGEPGVGHQIVSGGLDNPAVNRSGGVVTTGAGRGRGRQDNRNWDSDADAETVVANHIVDRASRVIEEVVVVGVRPTATGRLGRTIDASVRVLDRGVRLSPHQLQGGGPENLMRDFVPQHVIPNQLSNAAGVAIVAPVAVAGVVASVAVAAPAVQTFVANGGMRSTCVAVMLCNAPTTQTIGGNSYRINYGSMSHVRRTQGIAEGVKISRIDAIRRARRALRRGG